MRSVVVLCLLAAGAAAAESLSDPTRPPGNIAGAALEAGSDGGLRLQSVLSPQGGRASAIINGKVVRVGDRVGEARLVRLNETEAVLQGPNGMERLFLVPDVSKVGTMRKTAATDSDKRKKP